MTATRKGVHQNQPNLVNPGISTQEEADTLIILYGVAVNEANTGNIVHLYTPDTDVLVLALHMMSRFKVPTLL